MKNSKRFVFAAKWDDGSAEITVTDNGIAEGKHALATTIGGPRKVWSGPIKVSMKTATALQYITGRLRMSLRDFSEKEIEGGVTYFAAAPKAGQR